jgi:hypothetical protein
MMHYYMAHEHKEAAKKLFGFRQVPFYVVVDDEGRIQQSGSKIDWDALEPPKPPVDKAHESTEVEFVKVRQEDAVTPKKIQKEDTASPQSVADFQEGFVIDDLDF